MEICACFLEMLETTPYTELRISDLCQKLGIGRKVFYSRFRDKEACLNAVMDQVFHEAMVYSVRNMPELMFTLEGTRIILEGWKKQGAFLEILRRDRLQDRMVARAVEFSIQEDAQILSILDAPGHPCDRDILSCFMAIHFGLLLRWQARNFDTPVEEMAKKYLRAVCMPLICGNPLEK